MPKDIPEANGNEAAASPAKRQKLAHRSDLQRRQQASRVFAPFRVRHHHC